MKKQLLLLSVLSVSMLIAEAGQVNEQQARQKAASFFAKNSKARGVQTGMSRAPLSLNIASAVESVNDAPLYAFNLDGGGFVIVSGDDRTAEILGFSEKGRLDMNTMPSNMKRWLEGYVKKIQAIPVNAVPRQQQTTRAASTKEEILPKLKTAWGQYYPYNLHAPELHVVWGDVDKTSNAVTGCVATAMAQVLNYYRYPEMTLQDIDGYKGTAEVPEEFFEEEGAKNVTVKWKTEAIPAGTKIDWDHITDTYDDNSTKEEKEAVSRLMQYCGVAANMQYGFESAAGTDQMVYALYDVFGYQDAYLIHQMDYNAQGWVDALYDVISKEGPLLFGADCPDDQGGHQFILDGYKKVDGKDYFYTNWGWNGEDDGYMLLDVMSPGWIFDDNGQEIGFTEMQMATPGLGPNGKGVTSIEKNLYCDEFQLGEEGTVYERFSKSEGFDVEYVFYYSNYNYPYTIYQVGIGYFQNDEFVTGFWFSDRKGALQIDLPLYYYWGGKSDNKGDVITVGEGLPDGTYQVKLICSDDGGKTNKVCKDGDAVNLVTMKIKDNKATFGSGSTAITYVVKDLQKHVSDTGWHTLSGVRLNDAPSAKGVYIQNGRKVVIK